MSLLNHTISQQALDAPAEAFVELAGVGKQFGAVRALSDVDLRITAGRMTSVLGHNGAGKSTLIRIIAGLVKPSAGRVRIAGDAEDKLSPRHALSLGIRCVFQELSLCDSLTVYENTRVLHPNLTGRRWRNRSRALIQQSLDTIFPGHDIDVNELVGRLSIGRRQMIEIARAFTVTDVPVRLVILDEPTSALDAKAANQLMQFTRRVRQEGCSCLFVSHRLREILDYTDDIVVMRDGRVTDTIVMGPNVSASILVEKMGAVHDEAPLQAGSPTRKADGRSVVDITGSNGSIPFRATKGEIVGLSGLAGQGQRELLLQVLSATQRLDSHCKVTGKAAYVAGDRQSEGLFPLWTVAENLSIGSLSKVCRLGVISLRRERTLAERWRAALSIRAPRVAYPIRLLSGGNQQKVLVARAFASEPDVVLFDDPMRGVDVNTKTELYGQVRRLADSGCTFLWYTTEIAELWNCDRVYILRNGRITEEIPRHALSEERVISASFERT
ncbi:sugar ABC transporter ATP-binding protein [Methylocapsa sp. S129]|uniref:sugar ABC transporter ATP-binding protein n=1 Tax=Methylocapsa sp. S129 TaxID=1641869 RepID=UPI00131EAC0A|nr:sugar ABC transporter ATP-binding protein [Methylocapsa sp. S129]